jgi:hypothetical protein
MVVMMAVKSYFHRNIMVIEVIADALARNRGFWGWGR